MAADSLASALRRALSELVADGSARQAQLDQFWVETESDFTQALTDLAQAGFDGPKIAKRFMIAIGQQALSQFDALALPGLSDGKIERAAEIVSQRRILAALIYGRSNQGRKMWTVLGLTPPDLKPKTNQEVEA